MQFTFYRTFAFGYSPLAGLIIHIYDFKGGTVPKAKALFLYSSWRNRLRY